MATIYYKKTNGVLYLRNNNVSGYSAYTTTPGSPSYYVAPPWFNNRDITSVVIENVIKPDFLYYFFGDLTNLQKIQNISNINTSNATCTIGMFNRCRALTSLDVSGFNTSNVTNMDGMFYNCYVLSSPLDVSGFNTSKVTDMAYMFTGCYALTSLDVSGFNTSKVTRMNSMFDSCYALTSLDVSGFNTSNVTNMRFMFNRCRALTSLDVSGFDTSNVTDMYAMFSECNILTSLDVSGFNTSNVTSMRYMFSECYALTSLDVSHFNTSNVTDMAHMFENCPSLTTLDVSDFDTSNVTDMLSMFAQCNALISLDVSHFNTSNVTNMRTMFNECQALTSLDVSDFDTSNVTDMSYMFSKCNALISLDVSGFNTSNVTNMRTMFQQCNALTTLDVSDFDTSNVTDMAYMFRECVALTTLDVSGFDTSNVTGMAHMFNQCQALTSLEVSGFDTSNVTDMSYMFNQCNALTSLDVSGFDTSNVTDMSYMFNQCYALTSPLDVSGFNTSNVTNMRAMFSECFELESINLDNFIFNDVNAINMFSMVSLDTENPRSSSLQGLITINGRINDYTGFFENTTNLIVLKGNSPQLQQLTTTSANDNVKVWSLIIQPKGERDEEFPTIVEFTVKVIRFIANSDPITIKAYRNDSSTPMSLVWNESLVMDASPKTFTTEIGSVSENESINYTFEVSDTYGTSFRKTITVPTSYYTIDFLDGGKEISFGEIASAKDLYDLLTTEPSDWSTNWTDYYEIDNSGKFVPVSDATAPTFAADTYYKKVHDSLFKCKMDSSFNNMTSQEIAAFLGTVVGGGETLMNMFYPVGSYFITTDSTFNPNNSWAGTWSLDTDYDLVAYIAVNNNVVTASKNLSASGLGGTAYYTLTFANEMADNNYIVTVSGEASGIGCEIFGIYGKTTTQFLFDHANYSGTAVAVPIFSISVFGNLANPEKFKWHRIG